MKDSLRFLLDVWEAQEVGGFVFLSLREDKTSWRDLAFKLGTDEIEIPDPTLGDVYFCPNIFKRPRRRRELVLPSCWLYADLDTVDPVQIAGVHGKILRPTVCWESSLGRFQAMWHMDRSLPREQHDRINQRLTYQLGADKGGWDITQVLRVPGTINHKYEQKPQVKLLWS